MVFHKIKNLKFEDDCLTIEIDGEKKKYKLIDISKKLAEASEIEKTTYQVSPSGYGIHWPLIDEDLSIDGLLGVVHRPALERSAGQA